MIHRSISDKILQESEKSNFVFLSGPSLSGKSTLVKAIFPNYKYIALSDSLLKEEAGKDPIAFLSKYSENQIIDDLQEVPLLLNFLEHIKNKGRSSSIIFISSVKLDTPAYVACFYLFPLDFEELKNVDLLPEHFEDAIIKGFYPSLYDRYIQPDFIMQQVIQRLIQDISLVVNIRVRPFFDTFLQQCALSIGKPLNLSKMASRSGVTHTTARRWLELLQKSYILFLVHPYTRNATKRLQKSPRLYFFDTGLASYLMQYTTTHVGFIRHKETLFANLIVAEYVKQMYHKTQIHSAWFWGDAVGNSVTLLVEKENGMVLIDTKATTTPADNIFSDIRYFMQKNPQLNIVDKKVVYGGDKTHKTKDEVVLTWKDTTI